VKLPFDEAFRRDAARVRLRFNCEDCTHFDGTSRCVHGFPLEKHRRAQYEAGTADAVCFCKEFELI
jgi:hypothetical protein